MFSRWIFYTCCLLPIVGWAEEDPIKNELTAIEQKIQALEKNLQKDRLKEMDKEVKGQGYMIADWEAYSKEIEQIRKLDVRERQIEDEIQQLELQKAQLLKQIEQVK